MSQNELPKPHQRLWRTWLGWMRPLGGFSDPLTAPTQLPKASETDLATFGSALILEDHTYVLHRDGTITTRVHTIQQLWSPQSLATWDYLSRVSRPPDWRTTIHRSRLYTPEGTLINPQVVNWADQAKTKYCGIYFRPLRPGVIVELDEQCDWFQSDVIGPAMWRNFFLKTGMPCLRRRLTVAVAPPFSLRFQQHHGAEAPIIENKLGYAVHRWDLHNVPGVSPDLMPHGLDFLPWIDLSTLPSWTPVHRQLTKALLPLSVNHKLAMLARELTKDCGNEESKVCAIYEYLVRAIRYGRPPNEWGNTNVRQADEVLAELRGDCKDQSALLVGMLNQVGISAQVAVVTTSEGGRASFLPANRFNHAIVRAQLQDREMWIDPTAGPMKLGDLPRNVQGVDALILGGTTADMTTVPPQNPRQHAVRHLLRGRMDFEGNYTAQVAATYCGEHGSRLRYLLLNSSSDQRQPCIMREVTAFIPGGLVEDAEFPNLANLGKSFQFRFKMTLQHWARRVRKVWIARFPWSWRLELSGALSTPERTLPLPSSTAGQVRERHEIELPADVVGYGLPKPVSVQNTWLKYQLRIAVKSGRLVADRRLQFFGGIVQPEDYPEFRRDLVTCSEADHAQILLVQRSQRDRTEQPLNQHSHCDL